MKGLICIIMGAVLSINVYAEETYCGENDNNTKLQKDSTLVSFPKEDKLKFTQVDTNYIEPQHFNLQYSSVQILHTITFTEKSKTA